MKKTTINLNAIKANNTTYKDSNNKSNTDTSNTKTIFSNSKNIELNNNVKKDPPKIKLDLIKKDPPKIKLDLQPNSNIIKDNKYPPSIEKTEITKAPPEKNNKPLFENYESVFKKDKTNILEEIKKLKWLPKTNIIWLSILIWLTISWIWILFYINPKIHNLNNYKTSIIDTYKTITNKTSETKIITKRINKGWYIYEIKIEKLLWKDVYIYKWKYFKTKEKLNKAINKEVEYRKKAKLIKILKNSFTKQQIKPSNKANH